VTIKMLIWLVTRWKRVRRKVKYDQVNESTQFLFSKFRQKLPVDKHCLGSVFTQSETTHVVKHYLPAYKSAGYMTEEEVMPSLVQTLSHEEAHIVINRILIKDLHAAFGSLGHEQIIGRLGL